MKHSPNIQHPHRQHAIFHRPSDVVYTKLGDGGRMFNVWGKDSHDTLPAAAVWGLGFVVLGLGFGLRV